MGGSSKAGNKILTEFCRENILGLTETGGLRKSMNQEGEEDVGLLLEEITLDILSRLPVQSVLECRRVCKSWRRLLLDTYFTGLHLRRQLILQPDCNASNHNSSTVATASKVSFSFWGLSNKGGVPNKLCYVENDENTEQYSYKTFTKIMSPPGSHIYNDIVGSCNGLICLLVVSKEGFFDPVYIYNPITREYIILPLFFGSDSSTSFMQSGFGYSRAIDEYKVVRICYSMTGATPVNGQVEVYTLGSGYGWRGKGEIPYSLFSPRPGVLANGSLNWLDVVQDKIVAFDLADEEFHLLPSPPFLHLSLDPPDLCVLEGWLCLVHKVDEEDRIEIWLLKKKMSISGDKIKDQKYQSWSWSREFTIPIKGMPVICQPVALTKSGGIVLLYQCKSLFLYDPKTKNFDKVGNPVKDSGCVRAASHINSFISLKALGEDAKITGPVDGLGHGKKQTNRRD